MRKSSNSDQLIEKLKPVIRKTPYSQLTTDTIANYMDVSKATLYKHFTSRDEIIEKVVVYYMDYIAEEEEKNNSNEYEYIEKFQKIFDHSLKGVIFVTDIFLEDLHDNYHHLYERWQTAIQKRYTKLSSFFESGIEKGIFNNINPILFMIQDDSVLRKMFEPSFSVRYNVTLKQAILDYYQMKKFQLIAPEWLGIADDDLIIKEVEFVLKKL
ncbi:TetR family transcriptional regulator [Gracilibacillus sp. JCM 18860]|uniref:TetR family transcriptional regulator n=1 Tax=Gracilibacillus sp. JCM 18860 TaxID=1306159 RepID=UPI0006D0C7E8